MNMNMNMNMNMTYMTYMTYMNMTCTGRIGCSSPGVLVAAMLSRPLGAAQSARLRGASLWAAGCGMYVNWPCDGVRPREMRVEGRRRRRRPWKPNKMRVVVVLF